MTRRRPWTAGFPLAVVVAGLVGCASAQQTGPVGVPSASAGSPAVSVVDLATRSGSWPATQDTLEAAVEAATRKCLAAQGFTPPPAPPPAQPVPEDEAASIKLADRRANGYGLAPDLSDAGDAPSTLAPSDPYHDRLSATDQRRYRAALFGSSTLGVRVDLGAGRHVVVPKQGCLAESRRALAGDVTTWARLTYLPQTVDDRLADRASTAPGYLAVLAEWRTCMAGRGHPHPTPRAARDAIRAAYDTVRAGDRAELRRREIAVAVADGECATRVHLPAAELTARRGLVATLPPEERRTLTALVARRDVAIVRARAVLAGTGPATAAPR
ncbi:hypothetical protein [Micromonospora cathayae]|uniref:PknH-like extracellular domain-containing protein n=1 Tax=Micromonospora cathayae TaxID=3028804 RepID=A0ABY8A0Q1_9ACTN|nr:hypothetical protein [Micromonospora sp. HUAS 3]WDZ87833.1 hypothetical protein PVK37_16200 [Micromonospora sp. HUAS 3]